MDTLALITAVSIIIWYIIDRFKPLWEDLTYGKYITILLAALGGFGFAFGYQLDILYACELVEEVSTLGIVATGLTLMSGSSAVSEIIERIKNGPVVPPMPDKIEDIDKIEEE